MFTDFYTRLVSNLLFPVHEWAKGHTTPRVLRELEQSQWLSHRQLLAFQSRRLREFLIEIRDRVPFYQDLFSASGVRPEDIRDVGNLQRLPLLTKQEIRANTKRLTARDAQNLSAFSTGGSSGEPLTFLLDKNRVSHDVAAKWRATRWWGVDIGDPEVVLWGSPIELENQDLIRGLRDRILRTTLCSAFRMNTAGMNHIVDMIRRKRPRMLFGYPSALYQVAEFARRQGKSPDRGGIRVAFVTGEQLYDYQKEEIEAVFGCAVANGYGGRDAGFVAHECPAGRMHITAEDIVLEIVDEHGHPVSPGQAGELVVTHLASRNFPFVRYRTGDIGVLSPLQCPCGRGLPVLESVQGRSTDFVIASDGTKMHGLSLIYVVRGYAGVRAFKIIQENLHHTRVLIVPDGRFSALDEQNLIQGLRARLGAEMNVDLQRVDEIPVQDSGKFRHVISHAVHRS